ncbi:aminomethyl-transferring glycine dehydrogenase subunit GcvPB [Conexibacter sp. SYSU D00693]|uniref:aminomethyl-transferring glycine dehydrogenase subunit GcvPB n=1 Tax=Conexibacter sp. SYSU D00693 TaxID=2812560 RepID=UPI001F120369|nr:aminomethyl-transferring glycine dehydrogenase subunit GcvPB [Conexibacter sp. SYSU D00693]
MTTAATHVVSRPQDETRTIFEKGKAGRQAFSCPELDVPERPAEELLPAQFRRTTEARLPEVSEPEIVRHYVNLSKRNFDLDSGFYPLGSCTMKHNPRLHERVAGMAGHARLHPLQDPEHAQGALELMWNLERALSEVSGLPHVSLQPSAGSHGELAGLLLTRAYHEDRGETRPKVLTPDTAHGTNPATVTLAGFEVVKVATNEDGGVDLDDLRAKATEEVACLMLTNPNTLGVFDPSIEEIASIVHGVGATLYYDGANLNAVMGISRPGDMGFDIVHFNLHKSFTQPHGGGGPGSGPIAVSDRIAPYLTVPKVVKDGERFDLDFEGEKSIGRLRGFQGNYGTFVRSYAYIRSLGAEGLKDASEVAVLNANYLLAKLRELGVTEHLPLAFGEHCMHEFVLSGAPMKRDLGIRTLDLAKRLLDHGFHPPTVYFPLLVDEALMVEPTETETKETLDAFAEALAAILREAAEDPEIARNAPYSTPVRRLDEAGAAKRPVIRQALDEAAAA